jgi:hypothetical protein
MRTLTSIAALTLAAGVLAGCGGDDSSSGGGSAEAESDPGAYCEQLETDSEFFASLGSGGVAPDQFGQLFERFGALAEQAPDEVRADWEVIDGAFDDLEQGLAEAGIEPSDLEGMAGGRLPEDVDPQALQEVARSAQSLNTADFEEAGDNISTHAQEECGIELGGSGETPTP